MSPFLSPSHIILAWQFKPQTKERILLILWFRHHVEALVKHKNRKQNGPMQLSGQLPTNSYVSLSAHHASSFAPTHYLPVVRALPPLLSESQIHQLWSNTAMSVKQKS